ncbi:MAG: ABC transporter permease [Candidatus Hydrogenedentes bacterium]|nr:ABC transporter permease [Candidatus Hydrogenedentota bacterium]
MSIWFIAWSYLWNRKLTTSMTILSVALAVGLIASVLSLREETKRRFEEEGQSFDVVIGAKGSPLQLVLSTLYFMDTPTGNIKYADYEALRTHDDVAHAYPIGLGDTYQGYRIVGTTPELLSYTWTDPITDEEQHPFVLAQGRAFEHDMEAVIGSEVARETGLTLGKEFYGTHGLIEAPGAQVEGHKHVSYTVVGILKSAGTPNDRAIFCPLSSVWEIHKHDEEPATPTAVGTPASPAAAPHADDDEDERGMDRGVTAVLVQLQSPALRFQFIDYVNTAYNAMAVNPLTQIKNLYDQVLGFAKAVLLGIGYLVVVISALSILIGLYLSILQRKRDMAIMRALGASKPEIFGSVIIEAFLVTILGIGCGWVLGIVTCWGFGLFLEQQYGLIINAFHVPSELLQAFATVACVGILAGIIPAWQAYRTDVARDLAEL